ncbi:hypothetical protein ACHAPU_006698 [Fusarium lateritium]
MPRRCVSLHCRSGVHPVLSSPEGIWVTNAMLARAVERFHHVYSVPRRSLSGCPGPLESRRRMGKRHMTAIIPDSHASILPWKFPWTIELPFSLGDWSWEAPVPRENRHKKTIGLFERFLRHLEGVKQEEEQTVDITPIPQTATLTPVREALFELNEKVALLSDVGNEKTLYKACEPYLLDILTMIDEKTISADDLLLTLDPFDEYVKQQAPASVLDNVLSKQWIAIIHCIYATRTDAGHDIYGGHVWHQCLKSVLRMTVQPLTCDFLDELLRHTRQYEQVHLEPSEYIELMQAHILFEASQFQQYPDAKLISTHRLRRNIYLTRMFVLKESAPLAVYEELFQSCRSMGNDQTERRTITFHMVLKLASVPGLSTGEFAKEVRNMLADKGWTEPEAWQFMAIRLMNRSKWNLRPEYLNEWLEMPTPLHSWAALLHSACHRHTKKRRGNFMALLSASDLFGHLGTLLKSVRLIENHRRYVVEMIKYERNPVTALAIWDSYNVDVENPDKLKLPWQVWVRHLDFIVMDPIVPTGMIYDIAEFHPTKVPIELRPEEDNTTYSIDILERIGNLYMKKPDLTARSRTRWLERTINYAQFSKRPMPLSLIRNYAEIQFEELDKGRLGRRFRFRWMIRKIQECYGDEQAMKTAEAIEQWRKANQKPWREFVPIFDEIEKASDQRIMPRLGGIQQASDQKIASILSERKQTSDQEFVPVVPEPKQTQDQMIERQMKAQRRLASTIANPRASF